MQARVLVHPTSIKGIMSQNFAVLVGERELLHVATSPLGGGCSGRFRRRAAMLRDSCRGVASTGCTKNVHVSMVFD